jgi:transketolase
LPTEALVAAVAVLKTKLVAAPAEIATRVASEMALDALTAAVPEMIGGSADLTGSNNTKPKRLDLFSAARPAGRFIHYGVDAAIRQGWDAIIGSDGDFVGMTGFGASAPAKDLYRHFGITAQRVAEAALTRLDRA